MLFNSIEFLLFFPAVLLIYWLIPGKMRMYWLLVTSYVFYMGWNPQYALLLLFSTGATWVSGLLIGWSRSRVEKAEQAGKKKRSIAKLWVALCLIVNLVRMHPYRHRKALQTFRRHRHIFFSVCRYFFRRDC